MTSVWGLEAQTRCDLLCFSEFQSVSASNPQTEVSQLGSESDPNSSMISLIFSSEDVTCNVSGLETQTRCDILSFGGGRATDYLDPVSHIPKLTKETSFLLLTTILVPAVCLAGGNDISQTARYFQSNKLVCTLSVN